jgi:hypothetical protein
MEATMLHLPGSLEPQLRLSVALCEMAHQDFQCCGSINGRMKKVSGRNGGDHTIPIANFRKLGMSKKN